MRALARAPFRLKRGSDFYALHQANRRRPLAAAAPISPSVTITPAIEFCRPTKSDGITHTQAPAQAHAPKEELHMHARLAPSPGTAAEAHAPGAGLPKLCVQSSACLRLRVGAVTARKFFERAQRNSSPFHKAAIV